MEHEIGISIETAFELNDVKSVRSTDKNYSKKKLDLKSRRLTCDELTKQLEDKLSAIQGNSHLDLINQMIDYAREYRSSLVDGGHQLSFVRTGIISISCSTAENEFIFEQFIAALKKEPNSPNVISVSAGEKMTVEEIIEAIYKRVLTEDLLKRLSVEKNAKKFLQSLRFKQFARIYQNQVSNKPIILIIDDLLFMNYETVNHLFRFLHDNLHNVPVLVFSGLSQASVSLQSIIRPETLSILLIRHFASKNTFEICHEVFSSVLIGTDLKLRFGGRCLGYFRETFNLYDFSIKNIERLAKLAIWSFSYSNANARLNGTAVEFEKKLKNLNDKDLESVWASLDSLGGVVAVGDVRKQLVELFKQMQVVESNFMSELKALHELISGQCEEKKKPFYQFYIDYLSDESDELEKLAKHLKLISKDEWRSRMENVVDKSSADQTNLVRQILRPQFEKLEDVSEVAVKQSAPSGVRNRSEFLFGNQVKAKNPVSNSPFGSWRNNTVNLINEHFANLLNPTRCPLKELFYYDDVEQLKQLDLVSLREAVLKRLASSDEFLTSMHSAKEKENNQLAVFRPDICVAFNLYRESQVKINLADWLESYQTLLESPIESEKSTATSGPKKRKFQADQTDLMKRFFSNLQGLKYLGILEKDVRSNDYVTKLIL